MRSTREAVEGGFPGLGVRAEAHRAGRARTAEAGHCSGYDVICAIILSVEWIYGGAGGLAVSLVTLLNQVVALAETPKRIRQVLSVWPAACVVHAAVGCLAAGAFRGHASDFVTGVGAVGLISLLGKG